MIGATKAADPTQHTTRKRARRFLRDDIEGEDIIAVPGMLSKLFIKELVLMQRSTATKTANPSKPGNEYKDGEHDHTKGEEHYNDRQATPLPSATERQAPSDKKAWSK